MGITFINYNNIHGDGELILLVCSKYICQKDIANHIPQLGHIALEVPTNTLRRKWGAIYMQVTHGENTISASPSIKLKLDVDPRRADDASLTSSRFKKIKVQWCKHVET